MLKAVGTGLEYGAPLIGWAAGRLVGNIVKVEIPPYISNTIMEQGAKYGEALFGKVGLGFLGRWIGKGVGLYQGVNLASSPFMKGAVALGSLVANNLTTIAVTTLFNQAGKYLKKGKDQTEELRKIEEILYKYQDFIDQGLIPEKDIEKYMIVMSRSNGNDFNAEGFACFMETRVNELEYLQRAAHKKNPEIEQQPLPELRELPEIELPEVPNTPIEEQLPKIQKQQIKI